MHTDPIADYLTRIRNAIRAGHDDVTIPASNLKMEVSRILKEQGYITDFFKKPAPVGESIEVTLKYTEDRRPVILGIDGFLLAGPPSVRRSQKRAARPGWTGTAIISSSVGVMTGHEARQKGVGGEVVAYVW